jgi:uncharacterized protein (DUF433 family)
VVLDNLAVGMLIDKLLAEYPSLNRDLVAAALAFG